MNLLSLEVIQKNHRRELEQRLENAKSNLKNLDRMAEEAFREIERRATEDKETLSKIFHTLTTNEEVTISSLSEELGLHQPESTLIFFEDTSLIASKDLGTVVIPAESKSKEKRR